jgi:hypothetical protein
VHHINKQHVAGGKTYSKMTVGITTYNMEWHSFQMTFCWVSMWWMSWRLEGTWVCTIEFFVNIWSQSCKELLTVICKLGLFISVNNYPLLQKWSTLIFHSDRML